MQRQNDPTDPQWTDDDYSEALEDVLDEYAVATTTLLADALGSSTRTARRRLEQDDRLVSHEVGGRVRIYYPQSLERDAIDRVARPTTDEQAAVDAATSENKANVDAATPDERVLFFPSRREIAVDHPNPETRETLSRLAHIVDSTEDGYLYKVSREDVWTAPTESVNDLVEDLRSVVGDQRWDGGFESRVRADWDDAHRYRLRTSDEDHVELHARDDEAWSDAKRRLEYNDHYTRHDQDEQTFRVKNGAAAEVKQHLYDEGYPAIDERRLDEGATLDVDLAPEIKLRDYQREWVDHFEARQAGVFVGPSGSGKTVAALGAMAAIGGETLIVVPNRELAAQWADEIAQKTTLSSRQIGQYHGGQKRVRPVTIATYDTAAMSEHRQLFNEREWGLVIADECHHAVADTWKRFREVQSVARLGLSATPVRESSDAKEIYTLIGPPVGSDWASLFADGWVIRPDVEIITVLWASEQDRERYERAEGTKKLIHAAANPAKHEVVERLLEQHEEQPALVFVDWVKQGRQLSDHLDVPFVYGETDHDRREEIYEQFRAGGIDALVISRVGDEGIDLPDAELAILASTMGSSRSQTAQRVGRLMRPVGDGQAYIVLTESSGEEDWGRESTQYLTEKGIDVTRRK
jgi:DNA excision repair protein ERCC-3